MSSASLDNQETEDVDPTSQIRPRCVPTWLLLTLSILSILISILSFAGSAILSYRGFQHNKSGIIAAVLIGLMLLTARILSALIAIKHKREPETFETEDSLKSSRSLRIAAFLTSLFTLSCAIGMLWSGIYELNKNYLHWFGSKNNFFYSGSRIDTEVWNNLIAGEFFLLITIFF